MLVVLIIVFAILALIGLFFAPSTLWGNYLFSFAMVFLAFIYAFFGFALLNGKKLKSDAIKEMSFNQAFFAELTGWGIALIIIGIMFKFQMWQGDKVILLVGILWVIVTLILDVYLAEKDENSKVLARHSIVHGAIALIIGVLIMTMSYDHVIKFYVRDDNDEKVLIDKFYNWQKTQDQDLRQDFYNTYENVLKKQRNEE